MRENYIAAENKRHFSFYYDDQQGKSITMDVSTTDGAFGIVKEFERFLKACGYIPDWRLTIERSASVEPGQKIAVREGQYNPQYNPEQKNKLMKNPASYDSKFDFSSIPNNNWLFGTQQLPALTTADLTAISVSPDPWTKHQFPTMAPITSEQIQSWSTEMPGTLGTAKYTWPDKDAN